MMILPEDVVGEQILRRLAPRDLAVCRCVCAAWKVAVEGCRLLRRDLLPLSVGGIFLNIDAHHYSEFFRPSSCCSYSGDLTHLVDYAGTVVSHCNGLLLLDGGVANPATGWFAPMPPWPNPAEFFHQGAHLVFDPAVSSHYSVAFMPLPAPRLLVGDRPVGGAPLPPARGRRWAHCSRSPGNKTNRRHRRTLLLCLLLHREEASTLCALPQQLLLQDILVKR
ncbi:unnamed protein product [Urochloa humidicola]